MFTVKLVTEATQGKTQLPASLEFTGIITDSRAVQPGQLFVALKGEKFDGHFYCAKALQLGAAGVLVKKTAGLPQDKTIQVADTLKAYQAIAHAYRKSSPLVKVVAITGSNGKTSTKDLIATALASKYKVIKTEANFNNEIGLPKTLLTIAPDTQIAVVEMGMRGFGQIRALKALAEPDTVVITNVGETHMELLGSMENIAKAKSEILENLTAKNDAILNGDDPYIQKMHTGANTTTYGIISNSAVKASKVEVTGVGTTFTYTSKVSGKTQYVDMPLIGRHNVMNALAAIAVAEIYGVEDEAIAASLHQAVMTEKRQEILHFGNITAINDAYNASPASMQTACNTLEKVVAAQGKGRGIAVLADMLELGKTSHDAHARVGGYVAQAGIKELITYGTEAKAISEAAGKLGVKVHQVENKEAAAGLLKQIMQPDDVILFKGSHSMAVDKVIDLVFKGEGK